MTAALVWWPVAAYLALVAVHTGLLLGIWANLHNLARPRKGR